MSGACLMSAISLVLTKKVAKKVEKTVILFHIGIGIMLSGLVGLVMLGRPSNPGRGWKFMS